jgi:hypothetical protein
LGNSGRTSLRHSYRSWLDAVGTAIAVLNVYGDVLTDEMAQAHSKVVRLAIPTPS